MKKVTHLSTHDVNRLLFGIPATHKHYRLALITRDDDCLVLSEALVAAIARAYVSIKTHPLRASIEMASRPLQSPKADFASYQLLETETDSSAIQLELRELLGKAEQSLRP